MKQDDVKISRATLSDMEQRYSYIADRLLELFVLQRAQTQGAGGLEQHRPASRRVSDIF